MNSTTHRATTRACSASASTALSPLWMIPLRRLGTTPRFDRAHEAPVARSDPQSRCTRAEIREHLLGSDRVARVVLRDALGQCRVKGHALVVIEFVEFVSPIATRSTTAPSGSSVGSSRMRRPFRTLAFNESILKCSILRPQQEGRACAWAALLPSPFAGHGRGGWWCSRATGGLRGGAGTLLPSGVEAASPHPAL